MQNIDPFQLFSEWYTLQLKQTEQQIPSACCLSTIGLDNYPNARFVSFKELKNGTFIITGPLDAMKGQEIKRSSKAAITFWWHETERQIRIQGDVNFISSEEADTYFSERSHNSQLVSLISDQGKDLSDPEFLKTQYEQIEKDLKDKVILRPKNWGGFAIIPLRIEFLEFSQTRFHKRTLFEKKDEKWIVKLLQP